MSTPQLSAGTVVDGSYTVGAVLRMRPGAVTYEATDTTGTPVAVTVYDATCFPSPLVLERCLRELRQIQSIASERIIPVLACGKHGDGLYEVNAPMPADTLEAHLANGPLPLRDAAALLVQVGEALLEAQRAGLVHRNLGSNVIFPSPEGVKITGFAVGEPHGPNSFGPLHTLAPEQAEGKVVDQRTLVYNLAALMHWMMSGRPLFDGDSATVLQHHLGSDPPADVHASLQRALSKDPRMRPMILKQFLVELAALGGVAPPKGPTQAAAAPKPSAPASAPSTRGWTMFMQAQDDEAPAPAQPVPAQPVPAQPAPAAAAPAQSAPAPAPAGAKPSTRGWTMFMEAQDEAPASTPDPEPAPAAAQPAPAPAGAKPSTRGWTMFMEAQDEAPASTPDPEPAPAAASAPAQSAPAPAAAGAKPSTRGWTMFMEAEDEAATPPADDVAPQAVAPQAVAPQSEPEPARSAAPAAAGAKPSTRGWTMFMEAEEGASDAPEASAPEASPAAPTAPLAAADPGIAAQSEQPGAAPSSRGWTMFMEPGQKPGAAPAAAAASPPAQEEPSAEADAPASTKRGWTMFMDAPLAKAKEADLGGPAPPEKPVDGASDNKGWTVFGAPALEAKQGAAAPASAAAAPAVAPEAAAPAAEARAPARGQTVIVDGFQPLARPNDGPQGVPGHAGHGDASGPVAVGGPAGLPNDGSGPVALGGPRAAPPLGVTEPASLEPAREKPGGSKAVLIVVLFVLIAAIAGGAVWFLGR